MCEDQFGPSAFATAAYGSLRLSYHFLFLLYLSRLLLETSWRQAVMLTPVVKSRLLVAAQTPIHPAANTCRTITFQQPVQQFGDHPLHLWHRQRGCFFFRAWSPS